MRMKRTTITALLVLLFTTYSAVSMAKGPNGNCKKWTMIPNLTTEQETKLKSLETDHLTKMLPLRNELNELQARQQTLQSEEKADMAKINANIDKISEVKATIAKERARFHQEIRLQLSDEQRLWFDTHKGSRGNQKGQGANCCPQEIPACDGQGPHGRVPHGNVN